MGAGGVIIIRRSLRTMLADPLVSGSVPADMRPRMEAILSKDENDCTKRDDRYLVRCISEALDEC